MDQEHQLERKILGWLVVLSAGVAALVVILGIGLSILILDAQTRGREVAHGAGAREARLEEQVKAIEAAAALRHAESTATVGRLEREVRLLQLRVDAAISLLDPHQRAATQQLPAPPGKEP